MYNEHLCQGVTTGATGKKTLHKSKHQSITSQPLQMRMNVKIHCLLKTKMAIKPKKNNTKRYTQFSPQKLLLSWILLQYTSTEFHSNWIIGRCLANTTPVYFVFSISNLLQVCPWTNPLPSSIHKKRRSQLLIFCISSLAPSMENANYSSHFPNWQKRFSQCKMDPKQAAAQQIQALTTNIA